jgi:2-keto-4-pentenoate hydratase/2-oxohepta-3-ene-1,7-dioic acid hydratase in catechol pathway
MASTTRRSLLVGAGAAAAAALLDKGEAHAAPPKSARGLTLANLRSGLGVRMGNRILDVARAAKKFGKRVPSTTDEAILGKDVEGLIVVIDRAGNAKDLFIDEDKAEFGPCIVNPQKIIMLGFNYRKHALEVGVPIPTAPVLFSKYNNALNGHGGTIKLPVKAAKKFDYEVELQAIIGKTARDVSEAEAPDYIFGYATGNDFSARDLQYRDGKGSQFMIGKTSDGFMPVGPWLVGAEVVGDPQKLAIECRVNGEQRQSSNTADMIFSCAQIVAYASTIMTLKPGDLISTGTPEGVINGKPPDKQVWLKAGDKVSCSVEKLGELRFELA